MMLVIVKVLMSCIHLVIGVPLSMEEGRRKFSVPPGFQTLLESLAREVLRFQPEDIYRFSAAFFDTLIQLRSDTSVDCDPLSNAKTYEAFKLALEDESRRRSIVLRNRSEVDKKEQQQPAEAVGKTSSEATAEASQSTAKLSPQNVSRGQSALQGQNSDGTDRNLAATKIQAAYKGYAVRKEHAGRRSNSASPAALTCDRTLAVDSRLPPGSNTLRDSDNKSLDCAATKIQAGIRGYLTRKKFEAQKQAAITLQAGARGYLTRKRLRSSAK